MIAYWGMEFPQFTPGEIARMAWKKEHGIVSSRSAHEDVLEGKPWIAWTSTAQKKYPPAIIFHGETEDEALKGLALALQIKLWEEPEP